MRLYVPNFFYGFSEVLILTLLKYFLVASVGSRFYWGLYGSWLQNHVMIHMVLKEKEI